MPVHIGVNYRRPWFEDRTATSYASLNGPMSRDAMLIQEALITSKNERRASRARAATGLLKTLVFFFGVVPTAFFLYGMVVGGAR